MGTRYNDEHATHDASQTWADSAMDFDIRIQAFIAAPKRRFIEDCGEDGSATDRAIAVGRHLDDDAVFQFDAVGANVAFHHCLQGGNGLEPRGDVLEFNGRLILIDGEAKHKDLFTRTEFGSAGIERHRDVGCDEACCAILSAASSDYCN